MDGEIRSTSGRYFLVSRVGVRESQVFLCCEMNFRNLRVFILSRENLRESSTNRTWKTTLINTFLVVILFFFSTPPIVLVTFEKLQLGKLKYIVSEMMDVPQFMP